MPEATETTEAPRKKKKLSKEIIGTAVKIEALGGSKGAVEYEFTALPEDIQAKLGPFGLNHKLGDAAAGKEGTDAEDAIQKVYDGLMAGDWSVRAPATPKVSVKALTDKLAALPDKARKQAEQLLRDLGVNLPE